MPAEMKRFLFLFLSLTLFHNSAFGYADFDECGAFEEILKRDFNLYQFDEPDRNESGKIYFEYSPSTYTFDQPASYKRGSNRSIYLDIMPESVYEKNKISTGSEIFAINSIETRLMDDEQINELVASSEDNQETLFVSIIDKSDALKIFELEHKDEDRVIFIPTTLTITNISSVDSVNSTYKAGYEIVTKWHLEGLSNIAKATFEKAFKAGILKEDDLKERQSFSCKHSSEKFESLGFWKPNIYPSNVISQEPDSSKRRFRIDIDYEPPYLDESGESQPADYEVVLLQDNIGIATFKAFFNYEPFPFDSQNLVFNLRASEVLAMPFFDSSSNSLTESFNSLELYDWKAKSFDVKSYYYDDSFGGVNIGISYKINLERNYVYFLTKIYLPIVLILFLAYSTLWVKPREIEARLTVSVVCFLALITYTFIIDRDLPKLAYLTAMDFIILYSYLFAAIPTLESIYVNKLAITNNELAERIDSRLRIFIPFAYVMITLFIIAFTIFNHPNAIEALKLTI
jgi:hypothetical protein